MSRDERALASVNFERIPFFYPAERRRCWELRPGHRSIGKVCSLFSARQSWLRARGIARAVTVRLLFCPRSLASLSDRAVLRQLASDSELTLNTSGTSAPQFKFSPSKETAQAPGLHRDGPSPAPRRPEPAAGPGLARDSDARRSRRAAATRAAPRPELVSKLHWQETYD